MFVGGVGAFAGVGPQDVAGAVEFKRHAGGVTVDVRRAADGGHQGMRRVAVGREVALEHGTGKGQRVGDARNRGGHGAGDRGRKPEQLQRALVAVGTAAEAERGGAVVAALSDAEVEQRAHRLLRGGVALAEGKCVGDFEGFPRFAGAAWAVAETEVVAVGKAKIGEANERKRKGGDAVERECGRILAAKQRGEEGDAAGDADGVLERFGPDAAGLPDNAHDFFERVLVGGILVGQVGEQVGALGGVVEGEGIDGETRHLEDRVIAVDLSVLDDEPGVGAEDLLRRGEVEGDGCARDDVVDADAAHEPRMDEIVDDRELRADGAGFVEDVSGVNDAAAFGGVVARHEGEGPRGGGKDVGGAARVGFLAGEVEEHGAIGADVEKALQAVVAAIVRGAGHVAADEREGRVARGIGGMRDEREAAEKRIGIAPVGGNGVGDAGFHRGENGLRPRLGFDLGENLRAVGGGDPDHGTLEGSFGWSARRCGRGLAERRDGEPEGNEERPRARKNVESGAAI